jgi:rhomboid protease GluP
MTLTTAPAASVPAFGKRTTSSQSKVYLPDTAKQWRLGAITLGLGLLGVLPLRAIYLWHAGGPMPEPRALLAAACILFIPLAFLGIVGALRGRPRLTTTADGIRLETVTGTKWANWDSLEPFVITNYGRKMQLASAKVIGPHASKLRANTFRVADQFTTPLGTIAEDLNAARAHAIGIAAPLPAVAAAPEDAPVGVAGFKLPWLTVTLLAVLVGIFILEIKVAPTPQLTPVTLFSMGALSRAAVLSGEWYRLFTAPLLHANFAHILGNGVALLWGGWLLERLVGRLWFFAFFVVGALGGSLMSLAVGPPQLVSVGASGALMGLFAALFVGSFHIETDVAARTRLQINSMRILIPSLLPLFSSTSTAHIDYGAHFGGAIAGALLAALSLKFWPQTERLPQLRGLAAAISLAGGVLFVVSAGFAVANFPKYNVVMIPPAELPHTQTDRQARAASLAARYPDDPRSHFYLGEALGLAKDTAGAERELRLALTDAQKYSLVFGSQFELAVRGILGALLAEQSRTSEAKDIARPVCSAPADKSLDNIVKLLTARHLCD